MKKIILTLLICFGPALVYAQQPSKNGQCPADNPLFTKEIANKLGTQWNNSLKEGIAANVVKTNYAPHAILLPTKSDEIRTDNQQIQEYFVQFLALKPSVIKWYNTQIYADYGVGVANGDYDFSVTAPGIKDPVKARYTFAYEYLANPSDGRKPGWYIITHHSSAQPVKHLAI